MHNSLKSARYVLLGIYTLCALLLTGFTLYLCYALEWRGPMRDLWEFVAQIEQQLNSPVPHWDWAYMLEPYGGIHRLLLPKILFYLDYRFFSGSNILSLNLALLLHISSALLFIGIVAQQQIKTTEKILLSSLVLLFFFSTTQIYNLIYTSDNQVVISHVLALFAAWFFAKNKILIANGLILFACLSHSSSLMLLPAMVIMLFVSHRDKKMIGLQVLFSMSLLLLYISGQDPLQKSVEQVSLWEQTLSTLLSILLQITGILKYIGLHLSSPTSRLWPNLGILITYLSITYLFFSLYRTYKNKLVLNRSQYFHLSVALYVCFIAIITAYGRQIYPNSALTDRYQTLVMSYWAALLVFFYLDLKQSIAKLSLFFTLPFIFSLLLLAPHQYTSAAQMSWLSSRVIRAHTAAIVGITDIKTIAATLSHPLLKNNKNLVAKHNDFLRDNNLGYFSIEESQYFSSSLEEKGNSILTQNIEKTPHCQGHLLSIEAIKNSKNEKQFRLTGTSNLYNQSAPTLFVIDFKKRVIGLARDLRAKGEFRPLAWRNSDTAQWTGFIRSSAPLNFPLSIIGKTEEENSYCLLLTLNKNQLKN